MVISKVLIISILGFLVVMITLAVIMYVVLIISKTVKAIEKKAEAPAAAKGLKAPEVLTAGSAQGGVRLIETDDKTAALIMAIISDETGITLKNLIFKSIKPVK